MRRWLRLLLVLGAVLLVLMGGAVWLVLRVTSQAREKVVAYLEERLDSEVELAALEIGIWPRPWVVGYGLVVRQRGATGVPPLVRVDQFSARATFRGLLSQPRRVRRVELEGLQVHVPPRSRTGPQPVDGRGPAVPAPEAQDRGPQDRGPRGRVPRGREPRGDGESRVPSSLPTVLLAGVGATAPTQDTTPDPQPRARRPVVVIDELLAEEARLEIGTRHPDRPPRLFELHRVHLYEFAIEEPTRFDVIVTNPTPPGRVITTGTFGPVQVRQPGATPLEGTYTFESADLGVFGGIDGTLTSRGEFGGALDRIGVRGKAEVADFQVTAAGNPVQLATEFVTVVDGTNGNTELTDVRATWLESALDTQGSVAGEKGKPGRTVALDVRMEQAALEDVLQFAVKGPEMPMAGLLDLTSRFVLPPGQADVIERMELDGEFDIAEATFRSLDVQKALAELSRRGRGDEVEGETGESVVSNLRGQLTLREGRAQFSRLSFSVPGAEVRLTGEYAIPREWLDFSGDLRLAATVSETQEGWRRTAARPFDRLFRKDGAGTVLPIRITGPRAKPKFSVDVKRIFR